jgi:hypothetical protein
MEQSRKKIKFHPETFRRSFYSQQEGKEARNRVFLVKQEQRLADCWGLCYSYEPWYEVDQLCQSY